MFKEGFHTLIPHELISIFNDRELELLISGLPEIDGKRVFRALVFGFSLGGRVRASRSRVEGRGSRVANECGERKRARGGGSLRGSVRDGMVGARRRWEC
eukprot:8661566-Pyramimonas_sp.AAC.2